MFDKNVANKATENYHLYVGRLQDIPEGVKYSFWGSKRNYLFLYTDIEYPKGFALVEPQNYGELTDEEQAWLDFSTGEVILEYLKGHQPTEEEVLMAYFDNIEERLKAMREELLKGNENERERAESGNGNGKTAQIP